jgi:ABC-type lipoprotein export system ATPase subunit
VQHFGGDTEAVWEKYITDIETLPPEFKVLGVNDYLFIDGYKKMLDYKSKGRLKNIELLLPVIEFRLQRYAGTRSNWSKINFHVIFSNELSPDVIQSQFLNQLKVDSEFETGGPKFNEVITIESVTKLGKLIKDTSPAGKTPNESDLQVGFFNITLPDKEILNHLKTNTNFNKGDDRLYLTAIGKTEWNSLSWEEAAADKKDLINKVDFVFTSAENIVTFETAKNKLKEQGVKDLLLDCSDAHYYSNDQNKDRIGKCFTWIKSTPSFNGLKQIIYEPDERIHVGDKPKVLELIEGNKTKYISGISFTKKSDSILDENWFNEISIKFNPQLVAVIGNKGNGKSALLDSIGLIGNSSNCDVTHLSFLSKFRKDNKASNFEGTIEWLDGTLSKTILSSEIDAEENNRVKYIPQNFFERLCNDPKGGFEEELKKVIFSHIGEDKRAGKNSLDALIEYKTTEKRNEIIILIETLVKLNSEIVEIMNFTSENNKKILANKLEGKEKELSAIVNSKPKEVKAPEANPETIKMQKELEEKIKGLTEKKDALELKIVSSRQIKIEDSKKKDEIELIIGELNTYKLRFDKFKQEISDKLAKYSVDVNAIISLNFDIGILIDLKNKCIENIGAIENDINVKQIDGVVVANTAKAFNEINSSLDDLNKIIGEPMKKYYQYTEDIKKWELKKNAIQGSSEKEDTIEFYKEKLLEINTQKPEILKTLREQRMELIKKIFDKKLEMVNIYKMLYKPIEEFAKQKINDKYDVGFDVSLKVDEASFAKTFFDFVLQNVRGTFYGKDEGKKYLKTLLEKTKLDDWKSFSNFIRQILTSFETDLREPEKQVKRSISEQLRDNDMTGFYNFLFCLNYLEPTYNLKFADKELYELSPGEKGALLLIFYLMLDTDNIPLIIDQPEENLDNQSVFELLVPYIKKAKNKRQLIIATHNPNLAVVCDAEQIIYANIDKTNKYQVKYTTGAIEDILINNKIVDVLEGTILAFNNRDSKYSITKRT